MERIRLNKFGNIFLAVLITSLMSPAGAAHAAMTIDFTLSGGAASTIYYNPGDDSFLHGTGMSVSNITGRETPANSGAGGVLAIADGSLNFTTGAFEGMTQINGYNTLIFGPGGSITLTGGISNLSLPSGTTLLSGSFTATNVIELPLGQLQLDIAGATFGNSHNSSIFNYFGIPDSYTSPDALSLTFTDAGINGGIISSSILSGNIEESPQPTPIPAAAWLLGSGLMGLAGMRKRMRI